MTWIDNAAQLGSRIRKWRERLNYSLDTASSRSGLPLELWAQVEAGEALPSSYQLHRMANAIQADPSRLILAQAPVGDPATGAVRFRASEALADVAAHDRRILATAAKLGRVSKFIREALGLPVFRHSGTTPIRGEPWRQGYRLGAEARATLGVPAGPIASVIRAFMDMGIEVYVARFVGDDVSAACVNAPDGSPVVVLNSAGSRAANPGAFRASLSHELCHLLHDADENDIVTNVSCDNPREQQVEARANAFSPAFLAPPRGDLRHMAPHALAEALMTDWWFSLEGAAWHAKNTLSLTHDAALDLIEDLRNRSPGTSTSTPELELLPSGFRRRHQALVASTGTFADLLDTAVARGVISAARAHEVRELF